MYSIAALAFNKYFLIWMNEYMSGHNVVCLIFGILSGFCVLSVQHSDWHSCGSAAPTRPGRHAAQRTDIVGKINVNYKILMFSITNTADYWHFLISFRLQYKLEWDQRGTLFAHFWSNCFGGCVHIFRPISFGGIAALCRAGLMQALAVCCHLHGDGRTKRSSRAKKRIEPAYLVVYIRNS